MSLQGGEVGYYAMLELPLDCSDRDINKQYKKRALVTHPDRNSNDPEATDRFQRIVTAYEVLSTARPSYDHILKLRTWLYQRDTPGPNNQSPIDPFLIYQTSKINNALQAESRILQIDFVQRRITNWKKYELRTSFDFDDLKSIDDQNDERMTLHWKQHRSYKLKFFTAQEKCQVQTILEGILHNTLLVTLTDEKLPPKSIKKGPIMKKGIHGGFVERWIMLGTSHLLVFNDDSYTQLSYPISLTVNGVSVAYNQGEDVFSISTTHQRKLIFKAETAKLAFEWVSALREHSLPRERLSSFIPYGTSSETEFLSQNHILADGDDIKSQQAGQKLLAAGESESRHSSAASHSPQGDSTAISPANNSTSAEGSPQKQQDAEEAEDPASFANAQQLKQEIEQIEADIAQKKAELEQMQNTHRNLLRRLDSSSAPPPGLFSNIGKKITNIFSKTPSAVL